MSGAIFILDRVAVYLTTPDPLRRALHASKDVRADVFARAEVLMLKPASETAIATVFACRQLATLELWKCHRLTALPGRLGDYAVLTTLNITSSTASPSRPSGSATARRSRRWF